MNESMGAICDRTQEHLGTTDADDHPHAPPPDQRREGLRADG